VELFTWGSNFLAQDDPHTALAWAQQAVEIVRALGPAYKERLIVSLFVLGERFRVDLGDPEPARAPYIESEALFLELGPDKFDAGMHNIFMSVFQEMKADVAIMQGHYLEAKQFAAESVRLKQAVGQLAGLWFPLLTLANACRHLGEYDQAREHLEDALRSSELDVGHMRLNHRSFALRWLGEVELLQGNVDRALAACHESLTLATQIPDYNIIATSLMLCAAINAKRHQRLGSARLAGAAKALYTRQGRKPYEAATLETLLPGWREALDQSAISQAFEAGQAMSAEQAVTDALAGGETDRTGGRAEP
jgi:tetratricopeptide (TPR) repeat protein